MNIQKKLEILAGAAKYDVSCASSGSRRENRGGRLGNAAPSGICHSFTEDGRCLSLLKVLFTNFCIYDCAYCTNRSSNDIPRAAFTAAELAALTIDFYRRNFIEGLFLSSGVFRSPDETMEQLIRTATDLRLRGFNGYIHSPESDYDILHLANSLYQNHALKRVYYSGYIPINAADARLPSLSEPPVARENRLYQADWLMRLYGYSFEEVIRPEDPYLDLKLDPKLAFALRQPDLFPVDINSADYAMILRVPGIGLRSAERIIRLRQQGQVRYEHLQQMGVALKRAARFIVCPGRLKGRPSISPETPLSEAGISPRPRMPVAVPSTPACRLIFLTDGTFQGLLAAVFEAFSRKVDPAQIRPRASHQSGLFEKCEEIPSNADQAERVWHGLRRHLGSDSRSQIYQAYLTAASDVETLIYRYIRMGVQIQPASGDPQAPAIRLAIERLSQKVRREAHRMKGLVRFAKMENGCYLSVINPRYDVLPLMRRHFEKRYASQRWIIFDAVRKYGFYFDLRQSMEIRPDSDILPGEAAVANTADASCQLLWRAYFAAVDIRERRNPKLHLRHLPRRYWQYLPEKN